MKEYPPHTCIECGKTCHGKHCIDCFRKHGGKGAHSPEERDGLSTPLCGAKKKSGKPCRAFAGQGTDHLGVGRCKFHLGNSKPHKTGAEVELAKRHMVTLGEPIDIQPHDALLGILRSTAGHVAWLNAEVENLSDLKDQDAGILVRLYSEERDRLTRIAKVCMDAGISAKIVEEQRRDIEWLVETIERAFATINLSRESRARFGAALRKEFAASKTLDSRPVPPAEDD